MRRSFGVFLAVAMLLSMVVIASPAGAAGGTTCKTFSGTGKLTPGLSNTAKKSKFTISVSNTKISGCNGGVTSGTVTALSLKNATPTNCAGLATQATAGITGSLTITWKPSGTSTIGKATLSNGPKGKSTELVLAGAVTGGTKFMKLKLSALISFSIPAGQCGAKPLTTPPFKQVTPLTIK